MDGTPSRNFNTFPICAGPANDKGNDAACSTVFKYGMKRDFNLWLASLGPGAPVKTLTELRNYNLANRNRGAIKYGQAQFDISDEMDLVADRDRYLADRAKDIFLARTHGIDEAMDVNNLDALLFPGSSGAGICGQSRLSHRHRAVRLRAQRAHAGVPGRLQRQGPALRRELHRHGLQRAAADRTGLRLRAGDQAPGGSAQPALRPRRGREPHHHIRAAAASGPSPPSAATPIPHFARSRRRRQKKTANTAFTWWFSRVLPER